MRTSASTAAAPEGAPSAWHRTGQPAALPERAPELGASAQGTTGRDADGTPRFDQPLAAGGYRWWYVDAISDDGRNALSLIAFVGSVFSPYYAWALARDPSTSPDDHCALNVSLYGEAGRRWTMTERGRARTSRGAREFVIGPSRVRWDGSSLTIDIDEIGVPIPRRVRGRIRVHPQALCPFVAALDAGGRHRWGPIAPCARIEVSLEHPEASWRGHAYIDANEGDEPIDRPFHDWDWSRAAMRDGSTAVIYDVRPKDGADRVIARRFGPDGRSEPFEAPSRQALPRTGWRIARAIRSEGDVPAKVVQTLEDTPFYARSVLESTLLGERVTSIHESLSLPRVVSRTVRLMLPWRMPRLA